MRAEHSIAQRKWFCSVLGLPGENGHGMAGSKQLDQTVMIAACMHANKPTPPGPGVAGWGGVGVVCARSLVTVVYSFMCVCVRGIES